MGLLSALLCAQASRASAAVFADRYSHSSTLLADGNILIAGGFVGGAASGNTQLRVDMRDTYLNLAPMAVARASHTATLLPDGRVLVAGGFDGAVAVTGAEFYNPVTNAWTAAGAMNNARYNHTATLLRNGNVLLCGGQTQTGALQAKCEIFNITTGFQAAGSVPDMLTPRTHHTATLVEGGRVFFTGGFSAAVTPNYMPLSEVFDSTAVATGANCVAGVGCFIPARPLNEGRAYNTATSMGNGKVMIAGGYSGRERDGSRGYLESTEIYDPIADSMITAPALKTRMMGHTATMWNDGQMLVYGGLGNITTTYLTGGYTINNGSLLTGRFVLPSGAAGSLSTMTVPAAATPSVISVTMDFPLSVPVTGSIHRGRILFSTPSITFPDGVAYLNWATSGTLTNGLQADLAGVRVGCTPTGTCGKITETFLLKQITGVYAMRDRATSVYQFFATQGSFTFIGGNITPTSPARTVTDGYIHGPVQIPVPGDYIGASISSGTFTITSGSFAKLSTGTVSMIQGGYLVIPAGTTIVADPTVPGGGMISLASGDFNRIIGTVVGNGAVESASSVQCVPDGATAPGCSNVSYVSTVAFSASGNLKFVVDRIDLSGKFLNVDKSTVIIESMVFSDLQKFSPKDNQWAVTAEGRGAISQFNHTAVLSPTSSIKFLGGRTCDNTGTCAVLVATSATTLLGKLDTWTAGGNMANPRGHHTATVLPTGKVLVAGGTDGPNTWASAELYNPTSRTFAATGSMKHARDLHTSSLLPSGRVLVAGGFSPGTASTGATNTSEIYYPDSAVWIPTSVMISSRDSHTATVLPDGNVLVAGGYNRGVYQNTAEIFYSTAGVWRQIANMPNRRANHTATLLPSGEVLLYGGINETGVLGAPVSYNPITGLWSARTNTTFTINRTYHHTATLLPSGEVLFLFGNDGTGTMGVGQPYFREIYDPLSDLWRTAAAQDIEAAFNQTATLLPNGIVLMTGGAHTAIGSGELADNRVITYDVTASAFVTAQVMGTKRAYHTATLLPDGRVAAIGGYNGSSFINSSESIYFTGGPDSAISATAPSLRQPSITTANMTLFRGGDSVTIRDKNLLRVLEGSGGGATSQSSHSHPRLILQALDSSGGTGSQGQSGFLIDLTTRIYQTANIPGSTPNNWASIIGTDLVNSSITVRMPELSTGFQFSTAMPNGYYHMRLVANAVYSDSLLVRVGPLLPAAVTQATGTVLSSTTVFWTWPKTALADESGYNIFYATSGIFISSIPVPTGADSASYLQTGLVPNTTAALMVSAFTLTGDGPLTTSATTYTLSTAPVSVSFSTVNVNDLVLFWNPNGNLPGTIYEVSMSSDDPSSNGKNPFTTSISTPVSTTFNFIKTTATIDNLTENTTYYFRVRACRGHTILSCDPINLSNFSYISSATTRSQVQGLTGTPCATPNGTTCINWTWSPIGPALKYRVYNATTGVRLDNDNLSQASFSDVSLGTNCPRAVRVSAVTPAGEGPLSLSTTRYTLAAMPGLVSPTLTTLTSGTITGRWDTNGNPPSGNSCNPAGTTYLLSVSSTFFVTSTTNSVVQTGLGLMSLGMGNLPPAEIYGATVSAVNGDGLASEFSRDLGSTATWAVEPTGLAITGANLDSVSLAWLSNGNASSATYQVTYSTDDLAGNGLNPFARHIATDAAANFAAGFTGLSATVSGLDTNKKYTFRVQARNTSGITTNFSNQVATTTPSGGAVTGSIAGTLKASADSAVTGSVGSPTVRTVSLNAPAGAFSSDVTVTLSSHAFNTSLCGNTTGAGVSISVNPPLQPVKPLVFTMTYTTAPVNELGDMPANRVTLLRWDPVAAKCVPMPTSVDPLQGLITATLNHLSIFVLGQVVPSGSVDTARVFPNPFFPSSDSYITFELLPAYAQVRIWTLRGELVFERTAGATGTLTWNGTNRWGRAVASGVYLATIQLGNEKKILKLVVLR